jgi:DNA end-binding protein Ku
MAERSESAAIRPLWSGTITFGLVSVPVELHSAQRSNSTGLRTVSSEGHLLQRRYKCPAEDKELTDEELVRGYRVDDEYVVVTDEELESLAPEKSREIDLRAFVDVSEISPLYLLRTYYLLPGPDARKPYQLLAQVMERAKRAGIATFVMRGKEYLAAIFAEKGLLRAQTLRYHDEVRDAQRVGLPDPKQVTVPKGRLREMTRAIEDLTRDAPDIDSFHDEYAERLGALATEKWERHEDVVEVEADEAPPQERVVDLMQALKERVQSSVVERGQSDGPAEPAQLSKKELYERAKQLDIGGRSHMTREELIEAIAEAAGHESA